MRKSNLKLMLVAVLITACGPATATQVTPSTVAPSSARPTEPSNMFPLPTPDLNSTSAKPGTPIAPDEPSSPTPAESRTLTILTHESFALSDSVLQQFEAANNVKVQFIKQGDAGQALNRAILTKDTPEADVLFGVDNTLMSRALEAGILDSYKPAALSTIAAEFQLDPDGRLTPIDFGDVCLNIDKAYFAQKNLPLPQSLKDLTDAKYKDLLVVENPTGSSPGLAFMLATVAAFGENGWLDYWVALKQNGVKVVEDWNTAYYTEFSGSSGKGPRPIVVSYASSPPAEVVFADPPIDQPPTESIVAPHTCFRQIEFAGIIKGTKNRDLVEKWLDFMLSVSYQEDLPLNQFVYPINPQAKLPDVFAKWSKIADQPANLAPDAIAKNRDKWIEDWTNTVLK
ncbi:MAG: thiamine ABC transporter substrate-binding protein [Thermoflexales bacterium]|nr:thiamine ABC transporter substrate-binding protein [Thermoflexales bacterium]